MEWGRILIVFLLATALLPQIVHAEFLLESVNVEVSNVKADGSVKVHESIKLIIKGEYSQALYDSGYSGYSNNDLSFWSTTTGLKDVKRHISPMVTDIGDFTLTPQPRKKCNPIEEICHGELILEYTASPTYNTTNGMEVAVAGTGLFTIEDYKPRTTRYILNPEALSFTKTEQGNIILDENVFLTIKFPAGTVVTNVNPMPEYVEEELPARISELTWEDLVLVKFTLIFEVEESLQEEVSEFFFGYVHFMENALSGEYGYVIIILVVILVGGYVYINSAKRKREE